MFDNINTIDLLDGLNLNPIPLEASQQMTTTKWLMAIQAKVNEIIIIRNEVITDAKSYTDSENVKLLNAINDLKVLFNNGHTILNGTIGLEKMKSDFFEKVNDIVVDSVKDIAQTVWFGINDDGYFYAVVPESWSDIAFNTNQDGNLILQY